MRILVTAPYHEKGRDELTRFFGEVIYRPWKAHGRGYRPDELIDLLAETKAEALIREHDEVMAAVISAHPEWKFIGVCRGTPTNVAVQQASQRGIKAFNSAARESKGMVRLFI